MMILKTLENTRLKTTMGSQHSQPLIRFDNEAVRNSERWLKIRNRMRENTESLKSDPGREGNIRIN